MTSPGLCGSCRRAHEIVSARGSSFWRCREHDGDPTWPKYPRLPVLECLRYRPEAGGGGGNAVVPDGEPGAEPGGGRASGV